MHVSPDTTAAFSSDYERGTDWSVEDEMELHRARMRELEPDQPDSIFGGLEE